MIDFLKWMVTEPIFWYSISAVSAGVAVACIAVIVIRLLGC